MIFKIHKITDLSIKKETIPHRIPATNNGKIIGFMLIDLLFL